jgi:hypothetical protein
VVPVKEIPLFWGGAYAFRTDKRIPGATETNRLRSAVSRSSVDYVMAGPRAANFYQPLPSSIDSKRDACWSTPTLVYVRSIGSGRGLDALRIRERTTTSGFDFFLQPTVGQHSLPHPRSRARRELGPFFVLRTLCNADEIFGNEFIIQDDSGRALVDNRPERRTGKLVAKSETVTVQGRFEHGSIHAQARLTQEYCKYLTD